jgi:DNA polymerase-3 subunit epsilon
MISGEYGRIDVDITILAAIDTLRATRARLNVACDTYGVTLTNAHSALADAAATAQLLLRVAALCDPGGPAAAPIGLMRSGRVLRRADAVWVTIPDPPYIALLAAKLDHAGLEASFIAYLELVERAIADLHLDADERAQLAEFANEVGLNDAQRAQAHRRFVNGLVNAALADGVVTDDELDALLRVAAALEVDVRHVTDRTRATMATSASVNLAEGQTVVFTGDDPDRPRERLIAHAESLGLTVGTGVTKTTGLLVAYDTASNSGKATKAQSYGIPVVSTAVFAAARSGDLLEAAGSAIEALKVITCPECYATWTAPARSSERTTKRCTDCAATTTSATRAPRAPAEPVPPTLEELVCTQCNVTWTRQRLRGRKPQLCPTCSAK